jgi:putative ABC transport system substrate-binding protein
MKRILSLSVLAALAASVLLPGCAQKTQVVGIVKLLEHPDVEACAKGIKDALAEKGYVQGKNVSYLEPNAQSQLQALPQIAAQLRSQKATLVMPIFTPTTQSMKKELPGTRIVFAAVTDPVGAGVVASLEQPGDSITGVSDLWPIDIQLALFKRLLPNARRVGVLYNPGEQNSVFTYKLIRAEAERLGLTVMDGPVSSANDILQTCNALKGRADFLYTANDITVASALDGVIKFCDENRIPFFTGDAAGVEKGSIATYSQSYYGVGRLAGELAARVLNGESPGAIPVVISKRADLYLNLKAALQMGVVVPESLVGLAQKVYR